MDILGGCFCLDDSGEGFDLIRPKHEALMDLFEAILVNLWKTATDDKLRRGLLSSQYPMYYLYGMCLRTLGQAACMEKDNIRISIVGGHGPTILLEEFLGSCTIYATFRTAIGEDVYLFTELHV